MKHLVLSLLFLPSILNAATITCYSFGKPIYSGWVKDVTFDDNLVIFIEPRTQKTVIIHADCIAKITKQEIEIANSPSRLDD